MAGHGEVDKIKQNTTVRGPLDPLFGIKNFVVTLLVTMYNLLLTIPVILNRTEVYLISGYTLQGVTLVWSRAGRTRGLGKERSGIPPL